MSASLRQISGDRTVPTEAPAAPRRAPPGRPYLVKLAALHDEVAETAGLAKLLVRAPYVAGVLGAATLAVVVACAGEVPVLPLAGWVALMLGSVIGILRAHGRGQSAPLERAFLRAFARDFAAILLYAGFAWGAGLFLALPGNAGLPLALGFAAGMPALVALILRDREMGLWFLAPATAMAAFVALMSPEGAEIMLAGGVVAGACVIVAAVSLFGRKPVVRVLQV